MGIRITIELFRYISMIQRIIHTMNKLKRKRILGYEIAMNMHTPNPRTSMFESPHHQLLRTTTFGYMTQWPFAWWRKHKVWASFHKKSQLNINPCSIDIILYQLPSIVTTRIHQTFWLQADADLKGGRSVLL